MFKITSSFVSVLNFKQHAYKVANTTAFKFIDNTHTIMIKLLQADRFLPRK